MSNTSVNNEEVEKILEEEKEILTPKQQLQKEFELINQNYGDGLKVNNEFVKSNIQLNKKQLEEKTDEELEEIAKNSLNDYYSNSINNLKSTNEKEIELLNNKASKLELAADKSKSALDSEIESAKKDAQNQAIKRGLARSSIIMKQLENYDDKKINQINSIENDLNNSIAEINYEIDSLTSRLEDSLKNFDLSYAVKLQSKINELKDEQTKKVEEVLEYNNAQALKEAQFNAEQNELYAKYADSAFEKKLDLSEYVESNGDNQLKKEILQQKFNVANNYFNSIPKAQALDELLNKDFDYYKNELGAYFYKLYSNLKNREN